MYNAKSVRPFSAVLVALAVVMLAGLVAGCSNEQKAPQAMPPVLVKAMTITARDVPMTAEYVGQTAGSREVEVRARVGGILLRRAYTEGRPVKKGDLMFEIDPETYQAAVEQAQGRVAQADARYDRARRELDRVLPLYKENAVSQKDRDAAMSEFDSAKAEREVASAGLKEARINLGYTKVVAPITGITSKETRSEGSLVTTTTDGSLLTKVSRLDPVYVNFSMPGVEFMRQRKLLEAGRAQVGKEGVWVEIRLADGTLYNQKGRVNFMDKVVDPTTGVIKARAEFANAEAEVIPGQFVRVLVQGGILKDAMLVPQRAVLQTQNGPMVWVLGADDTVQPRPVVIADPVGNDYLLEKGLQSGERIIVEGIIKVRPGAKVQVMPDAPANGAAGAPAAASAGAATTGAKAQPAKPAQGAGS